MRWAIAVVVGAAGARCMFACSTVSLDVGRDERPSTEIDAASDAGEDASDPATPALMDRLAARCGAAAGRADYHENAAALASRASGRWYFCPDRKTWYSPPPDGIEFRFDGAPTWSFLAFDADAGEFKPESGVDLSGSLRIVWPAGVAGNDAGVDEVIAPSDSTARNGLQLWLDLAYGSYKFIPAFETDPRRMQLREIGGDPARGVFVPID